MTEKLEAEKPIKNLCDLLDDEAQKKNTDNRKEKMGIRIIIIISSCWHLVKTFCVICTVQSTLHVVCH